MGPSICILRCTNARICWGDLGGIRQRRGFLFTPTISSPSATECHDLAKDTIADEPVLPVIDIDAELTNGGILTYGLVEEINRLAPFGRENPEPTFLARGAAVLSARRVGKDNNTFQIRLRLPGMGGEIKGVWFRNGDWADRLGMGDEVDVVFTPVISQYRGSISVEMMLKDLRVVPARYPCGSRVSRGRDFHRNTAKRIERGRCFADGSAKTAV